MMKKIPEIVFVSIMIISFPLGIYIGELHKLPISGDPSDFGDFGSFLGGICGLIALIVSIFAILQTSEINKRQNQQFDIQSFESAFFNLMSLFTQRLDSLELKDKNINGNAVFEFILQDLKEKTNGYLNQPPLYKTKITKLIDEDYKNEFSILLLFLKNITEFVDNSSVPIEVKLRFISIYHSSLTITEVEILNRIAFVNIQIKNMLEKYPIKLLSQSFNYE